MCKNFVGVYKDVEINSFVMIEVDEFMIGLIVKSFYLCGIEVIGENSFFI